MSRESRGAREQHFQDGNFQDESCGLLLVVPNLKRGALRLKETEFYRNGCECKLLISNSKIPRNLQERLYLTPALICDFKFLIHYVR